MNEITNEEARKIVIKSISSIRRKINKQIRKAKKNAGIIQLPHGFDEINLEE